MEPDERSDDDEPVAGWLHPDDRLWRHPSELAATPWPTAITETAPAVTAPVAIPTQSLWQDKPWAIALLSGVIGALFASGLMATSGHLGRGTTTVNRPIEQVVTRASNPLPATVAPTDAGVVGIAQRLRPTIVQINVEGNKGKGTGSGVLFRTDGHILTNNHVVQGASNIEVVMADGKATRAKLVGADPDTDVAIVKVEPAEGEAIPIAALGTAKDLKVGQQAVAIGSPLGLVGGPSVTVGVISAVGRQVQARDGGPALLDMIQTDAPIAPGSSGGALVDAEGEVIGITTAIALSDGGAQGLGFATPIDIARDAAEQLIATGKVVHVWIGVEGEDVDTDTATRLRIVGGAIVRKVREGSPADSAGLSDRDVITHIDGHEIASMGGLIVSLRDRRPGDKVTVGYWRNGDFRSATVTLVVRPKNL